MINTSKSTTNQQFTQVAGLLPSDRNIEFIGKIDTQEVLWMQNGHTLPWIYLPKQVYKVCAKQYLNDAKAVADLSKLNVSIDRQIELYIYHLYGDVDSTPDYVDGELQPSENYRHTQKCTSLDWDSKWITIDGIALTNRDLLIIDYIKEDLPDKAIADKLNISLSTFDYHKRNLYHKFNVQSKTALLIKALKQHV